MPRTKKPTVKLDKNVDEKLKRFKKVFDAVIEDKLSYDDYVNTVISIGLDSMLRTVVPSGHEWYMIQTAFENRYELMCDVIAEMWEKNLKSEEDDRSRIRKTMQEYIR
ncbi:MAG: hypothetical protein JSV49_09970 [Thermoplasmata archaeon]|nr:MAG: hypothetical protein JSV49_09970 [Thermoplasmata archaeon]